VSTPEQRLGLPGGRKSPAFKSLITNDPATVEMAWDFSGAELDLLAKAIIGAKVTIKAETVQTFVQGMVEKLLVSQIESDQDHRAMMVASLEKTRSAEYIASYLRGWDAVGNSPGVLGLDKNLQAVEVIK
jgi:hypothetical protein